MTTEHFLESIRSNPSDISFDSTIRYITEHYDYTPTRFTNGLDTDRITNEAGTNEGSCKIFAFGKIEGLSETETLACFGSYYRDEVLNNPDSDSHANIRSFIRHGWQGIHFEGTALTKK